MVRNLANYTSVASDAQLSPNTVRDYYQILEETLLGYQLAIEGGAAASYCAVAILGGATLEIKAVGRVRRGGRP